jgi:hypothetical protein
VRSERLLFKLGNDISLAYDVTSDGQKFLLAKHQGNDASMPVTLVVNWLDELKKDK